uniref:Uncharacterized protein n=1 Tax=Anguilla anguilla TaxID=7936 RepID=A0A0E9QJN0_ANGAN
MGKQSETYAKPWAYQHQHELFVMSLRRKKAVVGAVITKGLVGLGRPLQLMTKDLSPS